MQFRNINALTGYSAALDALAARQFAALVEIVFCYRLGSLSATAVFGDIEALRDGAGQAFTNAEPGNMDSCLIKAARCKQFEHAATQQINRANLAIKRFTDRLDNLIELGLRMGAPGHNFMQAGQNCPGGGCCGCRHGYRL